MNIKTFIQEEKIESITDLKGDIKDGFMDESELNEEFIETINSEIELILWKNIKADMIFNLIKEDETHYKTMLGTGKEIKFSDLYEILKRLYDVHHESQIFTLKFDSYEVEINKNKLENYNFNFGRMILDVVGNEWHLKLSDFQ